MYHAPLALSRRCRKIFLLLCRVCFPAAAKPDSNGEELNSTQRVCSGPERSETPQVKLAMPRFKLETPRIKFAMRRLKLETPRFKLAMTRFKFEMPQIKFAMRSFKFDSPRFKLAMPRFKLETPQIKLAMRRFKFDSPCFRKAITRYGAKKPRFFRGMNRCSPRTRHSEQHAFRKKISPAKLLLAMSRKLLALRHLLLTTSHGKFIFLPCAKTIPSGELQGTLSKKLHSSAKARRSKSGLFSQLSLLNWG